MNEVKQQHPDRNRRFFSALLTLARQFQRGLKTLADFRLVWQPWQPNTLSCGLSGIVAFKRAAAPGAAFDTITELQKLIQGISEQDYQRCQSTSQTLDDHYLCGQAAIDDVLKNVRRLKQADAFYQIYTDAHLQHELTRAAGILQQVLARESGLLEAQEGRLETDQAAIMLARLEQIKDIIWCITVELQNNIGKIKALQADAVNMPRAAALTRFKELNAVLNSLERLEVRGRDSAGISLLVTLSDAQYQLFTQKLALHGLTDDFQQRGRPAILLNRTIRVTTLTAQNAALRHTLAFTYKVAAEVGALGDNTRFIRQQIQGDAILQQLISQPVWHDHSIAAHTRWASVGAVTEINCHPLDNHSVSSQNHAGLLQVCLNGDIDNYLELKSRLAQQGQNIPAPITTDTQIIPLQIQYYLQQQHDIVTAFRLALNDFTGSHAIALQTSLAPGKLLLGQRGSGQSLYVGIAPDFYMAASEVYGVIEETSAYLKLESAVSHTEDVQAGGGQIFIISPHESGGIEGIQAMDYSGKLLELSNTSIKISPITSRDIDRQDFPHYFLKEISEAPRSVAQTLQNRWRLSPDSQEPLIALDHSVVPEILQQRLRAGEIRRIFFVGQGTAGVAASACAEITGAYLEDTPVQINALKASELSGYKLPANDLTQTMQDTLVVAISQSGTTTDTNRAVDLVRQQGAATLAIVNRRDSDLTFRVDGVLYTSSGRDIEMSVASTKAFYSQIVAGAILGLHLAQVMQCRSPEFIAFETRNLLALPDQMRQVLTLQDVIAASARRLALTRTYWAAVGSGPNKTAADEIRIKLSELCYKTISSDYVEDKKHIDLSSEPLIIVCAAGSRGRVIGDIIKDTAIFQAHKALPVVIADAGELRFEPYAADVFYVPVAPPHLAPILNTLVGHLWGYNAALAINASSRGLFGFREELQQLVQNHLQNGLDIYEIILEKSFREKIAAFYTEFRQQSGELRLPADVDHTAVSDLLLLLKYLSGRLPVADFEMDFGQKGTALNMLDTLLESLGRIIAVLARPVDAIKHQAKTVTVGTSRIATPQLPRMEGVLFDALRAHDIDPAQLTNINVLVLKHLQEIVATVRGTILYAVEGLNLLGEPGDDTTVKVMRKTGILAELTSRVETDARLKGTKRIIVQEGNVFIGKGRSDQRNILIVPILAASHTAPSHIQRLLLLNIMFKTGIPLETRIKALGGKYERIKNIVQENSLSWNDAWLETMETDMLFGVSAEKSAEYIVAQQRPVTAPQ